MTSRNSEAALALLTASAVRERTARLFQLGVEGGLDHFTIDLGKLSDAAKRVAEVTRKAYPDLKVPFHARWRHFVHRGEDRWARLDHATDWSSPAFRARAAFDLVIVSVLLDAGAGGRWRHADPASGDRIGRSEGLALASLGMFAQGMFSARPGEPLRADAERLAALTVDDLKAGFQVSAKNPLAGIEGRAQLLNRLGKVIIEDASFRDAEGAARPGALFDLLTRERAGSVSAPSILAALLRRLGDIWPPRLSLDGIPLGDTWQYEGLAGNHAGDQFVPFHKLSQWLAYSLLEPLRDAGFRVIQLDALTGLAEYRNGGLFLDGGVIVPKDNAILERPHEAGSAVVVEWRALTIQLLDRLAPLVRAELGVSEADFPLAMVLEGGTWAAGRVIARERRADGAPPLRIISDGTVF